MDTGIERVGRVVYSLDRLDHTKVRSAVVDGVTHYSISLTLNIRLNDEMGHLVFRILHGGREVGKAEIDLGDS